MEVTIPMSHSHNHSTALIGQYKSLIQEAITECSPEKRTQLDIGKLSAKLNIILKAAKHDGLPEDMVNTMIDEAIPGSLDE